MQGDKRIDKLMLPVLNAINRHVKDIDAKTDIYNRAYEAVMISVDVKPVKRDLSDAEINELGAQEAEKRGEK